MIEKLEKSNQMLCTKLMDRAEMLGSFDVAQRIPRFKEDLLGITSSVCKSLESMPLMYGSDASSSIGSAMFDIIASAIIIALDDPTKLMALAEFIKEIMT
jgi:hypothetical protein